MRRKSTRDTSSKTSDSPKKSVTAPTRQSARTRSSRNKELSISINQEESSEVTPNVSENEIKISENDQDKTDIAEITPQESTQQVEDNEESEKGKSNDIVNKNAEQARDVIEPEIENENVQGTAQSPSKDNDENVQNVNDLQTNVEENEDNQQPTQPVEEEPQQSEEQNFESEYVQATDTNSENLTSNVSESQEHEDATAEQVDKVKTSTTPDSDKSKQTERKKITLRRNSPVKEVKTLVQENIEKENIDGSVSCKKIILKRPTVDEETTITKESEGIQRRSSVGDDNQIKAQGLTTSGNENAVVSSNDEIQQKHTKKVKLIRSVSLGLPLIVNTDSNESQIHEKPTRKPHWGNSSDWLNNLSASMYKIDMESIKIVCPTVQFLSENELKLESVPRERKKSESEIVLKRKISMDNNTTKSEGEEENGKDTSGEESETDGIKENIISINRKISIVDDIASKLKPPPSPAKNPVSNVLFITNLVRPFTLKQLKELLERTGKIQEDGFWTDRIKSKCYVQYHTEEEAEVTRNALHGVNWPVGNGKQLIIDYATEEDMKKAQNPAPILQHVPDRKFPEKENWEPETALDSRYKDTERFGDTERRRRSSERESFRGKETEHRRSTSRSRDRNKERKYGHRSYTPDGHSSVKRQKKDEPAPQKLMDDLFLKTKATPSIYWQPLSPDEIATKQKQRLVRMEEHKRRIELSRDRRNRDTRRPPYRRR